MGIFDKILAAFWGNTKKQDDKRIATLSWPDGIKEERDFDYYGDGHKMHLIDVVYPENAEGKLPVIIDIHGGGWMYGDKELNKNYCHHLAKRGYVVFVMSYRLYPEITADEQLREVALSLKWIKENMKNYPCDEDNILLTGDSAGGMLSCFTALLSSSAELRDIYGAVDHGLKFKALCLTSPMLFMNPGNIMGVYTKQVLGKGFMNKKWGAHVNLDSLLEKGTLPPTILVTSAGDFLAKDQTLKGYEIIKAKGIKSKLIYYGENEGGKALPHVFAILYPEKKPSVDTIEAMLEFWKEA